MRELLDVDADDFSSKGSANSFEIGPMDVEEEEITHVANSVDNNVDSQAQTAYGLKRNEFEMLGSDLLCKTVSSPARKRHEINGSRSEKYCAQKFCSLVGGTYFPLLHP